MGATHFGLGDLAVCEVKRLIKVRVAWVWKILVWQVGHFASVEVIGENI